MLAVYRLLFTLYSICTVVIALDKTPSLGVGNTILFIALCQAFWHGAAAFGCLSLLALEQATKSKKWRSPNDIFTRIHELYHPPLPAKRKQSQRRVAPRF
ncbi:hypothetical protein [Vibrio mediterranei]|uniref:hypothetical protein n=1 Tax=Vibrio mediterranei TaxID=689 RepID=UPI004068F2EC